MCEPVSIAMAVMSVVKFAVQAAATSQANKASRAQQNALNRQAERRIKAEQRQKAFDDIQAEREVKILLGRNRALMGAFGIAVSQGTTAQKLLQSANAASALPELTRVEAMNNRIFSIESDTANKFAEIGQGIKRRNFALASSAFGAGSSILSVGFGSKNTSTTTTTSSRLPKGVSPSTAPGTPF